MESRPELAAALERMADRFVELAKQYPPYDRKRLQGLQADVRRAVNHPSSANIQRATDTLEDNIDTLDAMLSQEKAEDE